MERGRKGRREREEGMGKERGRRGGERRGERGHEGWQQKGRGRRRNRQETSYYRLSNTEESKPQEAFCLAFTA